MGQAGEARAGLIDNPEPTHRTRAWTSPDDMLGLFPGGNKTRKLELLVAGALAQGANTRVTCGAPQSNHCRITPAAAVKEGLKCRFIIEERVPGSYEPLVHQETQAVAELLFMHTGGMPALRAYEGVVLGKADAAD